MTEERRDRRTYDEDLAFLRSEVDKIKRRVDFKSTWLFGHTLNGEGPMSINPTHDSWCGRVTIGIEKIGRLEAKMNWQTAVIVGAGAVINIAIMIWNHYA